MSIPIHTTSPNDIIIEKQQIENQIFIGAGISTPLNGKITISIINISEETKQIELPELNYEITKPESVEISEIITQRS